MMKRNPACATRGIQERIEDRPVSNCVRSVLHSFGLTKRRGHRSGVEMIAADRNRRFQITTPDEFIDRLAHLRTFAVPEPSNARGQSLKVNPVARQTQPAIQSLIFWKKFQGQIVSLANLFRFP